SLGRHPLFQVTLALRNDAPAQGLPGVRSAAISAGTRAARFDLSVSLGEARDGQGQSEPGGLRGQLMVAADLFDEGTARAIGDRLVRVLAAVAADPAARLRAVRVLDAAERTAALRGWNDTADPSASTMAGPFDLDLTVAELFSARAARTPDVIAVVCGDVCVSYGELEVRANRLAGYLRGLGAGPEQVVGLCLERGAAMITAIVAVWEAGAAYLPLDPDYPAGRLAAMLAGSRARLVLTRGGLPGGPGGAGLAAVPVADLGDPRVGAAIARMPATAPPPEQA